VPRRVRSSMCCQHPFISETVPIHRIPDQYGKVRSPADDDDHLPRPRLLFGRVDGISSPRQASRGARPGVILLTSIFVPNPGLGEVRRITQFLLLFYSVRPGVPQRIVACSQASLLSRFLARSLARSNFSSSMVLECSALP